MFPESSIFNTIVNIGNKIVKNIFEDLINTETNQGLNIIISSTRTGLLGYFNKAIHLTTQFFISVGLIISLSKWSDSKFKREYLAFSIPFFGLSIAGILVPYFASTINTSRLYGISLLILAPFCVVGGSNKIFKCSEQDCWGTS